MFRYVLRWLTIWSLIFIGLCILALTTHWSLLMWYLADLFGDFLADALVSITVILIGGGIMLGRSSGSQYPKYHDDFYR